jgi:hypothetical protein
MVKAIKLARNGVIPNEFTLSNNKGDRRQKGTKVWMKL